MFKYVSMCALLGVVTWATPSYAVKSSPPADDIHEWALNQMIQWSPPGHTWLSTARETPEEAKLRYRRIVDAAMIVAYDPEEKPLFSGDDGRARTLAVILATAAVESNGFRKDIDLGIGEQSRGDHGKSWCMMQIMLSPLQMNTTRVRFITSGDAWNLTRWGKGWTGPDLVKDRQKCFRAGLHVIRVSMRVCKKLPLSDKLSLYTSGNCRTGIPSSRDRMNKAIQWVKNDPPPTLDSGLF